MKSPLEESIKKAVEQVEMPFNEAAWTKLASRLDGKPVAQLPKKPVATKWILGGVGVVAIATTAAFLWNSTEDTTPTNKNTATEQIASETTINPSNTSNEQSSTSAGTIQTSNSTPTSADQSKPVNATATEQQANKETSVAEQQKTTTTTTTETNQKSSVTTTEKVNTNTTQEVNKPVARIVLPAVHDLCVGESMEIKNSNSAPLLLNGNGEQITLSGHQKLNFKATEPGVYELSDLAGNEFKTFRVNQAEKARIDVISAYELVDAVPTTELALKSSYAQLIWKIDGETSSTKSNHPQFHLFEKGTHSIEAHTTDAKGCKSVTEVSINVPEDYNLFAPNAFIPSDADPRKASFIPYALQTRDLAFTMIIIDPRSGQTVYTTTDASQPWDGNHAQTGAPCPNNVAYIWKVELKNPLPGEKRIYQGTIAIIR